MINLTLNQSSLGGFNMPIKQNEFFNLSLSFVLTSVANMIKTKKIDFRHKLTENIGSDCTTLSELNSSTNLLL